MGVYFIRQDINLSVKEFPTTDYLTQVAKDWEVLPYIDIAVFDSSEYPSCPSDYPEPVFSHLQMGTQLVCDCTLVDYIEIFASGEMILDKECNFKQDFHGPCFERPAVPPLMTTSFNSKKLCGRQGQYNFLKALRPTKGANGQYSCPQGTEPCYSEASAENLLCHDSMLSKDSECPITAMNFTEISQSTSGIYLNNKQVVSGQTYQQVTYNSTHNFVFSRQTDNLPITSTFVGMQPCMDPVQQSQSKTVIFFADISERANTCTDQPNGFKHDGRYQSIGRLTDEFTFREDFNKYNSLQSYLPGSEEEQSYKNSLEDNSMNFYTRSTVSWGLDCGTDLQTAYQSYKDSQLELKVVQNFKSIWSGSIAALIITLPASVIVTPCILLRRGLNKDEKKFMEFGIAAIMAIVCTFMMFILAPQIIQINQTEENLALLKVQAEGCTDQFGQVGSFQSLINSSSFDSIKLQFYFLLAATFCSGIQIILLICFRLSIMSSKYGAKQRNKSQYQRKNKLEEEKNVQAKTQIVTEPKAKQIELTPTAKTQDAVISNETTGEKKELDGKMVE